MNATTSPGLWSTVAALPDYLLLAQTRQLARHEQALQMLLSHRDPHLTLGGLVARLVRDGLHRYDPERPRRARRSGSRGSINGARTTSAPGRRDTEAVQRSVARVTGSAVERRSEVEQDASPAAVPAGAPGPSVPKRHADAEHGSTRSAPTPSTSPALRHSDAEVVLRVSQAMARDGDGQAASAPKRHVSTERVRLHGLPPHGLVATG